MKKHPMYVENQAGGLDLIVEKDSGNDVRILTGKKMNSLVFWKQLKELCEGAIFNLQDSVELPKAFTNKSDGKVYRLSENGKIYETPLSTVKYTLEEALMDDDMVEGVQLKHVVK